MNINLDIQLVGVDPGDALRQQWEDGIEGIWSNNFDVLDVTLLYPIVFDVNWVNENSDQIVTVHPGPFDYIDPLTGDSMRVNMTNWIISRPNGYRSDSQGQIAAHEAGHMFGLYDEYDGGVLNPDTGLISPDSIIGANLGLPRARHYQGILEWLETGSGRGLSLAQAPFPPSLLNNSITNFSDLPPQPVPEPSTLLLLTSGLVGLVIMKKRSNKKKDTV